MATNLEKPSFLQVPNLSSWRQWAGLTTTGLVIAFLVFDGVTKVLRIAPVREASEQLGLPQASISFIGLLLLGCTVIYAFPTTSVLGAILLTGYLGGATAIQVRAGNGAFPIAFAVGVGVLVWVGLALRERRLLAWIIKGK